MKNCLGLILISLCMFAWSGDVRAQSTDQLSPGEYTVIFATGGHLEKDDVFHIEVNPSEINRRTKPYVIKPNSKLLERWSLTETDLNEAPIELNRGGGPNEDAYCGFVDIDTTNHKGNQYGHDKTHGFLVQNVPNSGEPQVKIIWSALPLSNKDSAQCGKLNKRFHGGMAHASQ